ncbi:MAG: hypothetical protein ACE5NP_06345 [Anaerolineae bacterium]
MTRLSSKHFAFILGILSLLSMALYLGFSFATIGDFGFPLDDGWIHQTYARNLALHGQLAFLPGQPSAGSTAPLWSLLLTPGYLLPLDYRAWTYFLGALLLALSCWLLSLVADRLFPDRREIAPLAALFCALEWHLNWAAFSGMETLLFIFLSLLLLYSYFNRANPFQIGLVGGLLILARPEGAVLLGLVALAGLGQQFEWGKLSSSLPAISMRTMSTHIGLTGIGFALPIIPYLAFNLSTSGLLFPNTFYAKQAEFSALFALVPLPLRLFRLGTVTFVGAQVLLVPGFLYAAYLLVKERRWAATLPLLWWLTFPVLYALRLPVIYQHGRYLIPTIPIMVPYALWGTAKLLRLGTRSKTRSHFGTALREGRQPLNREVVSEQRLRSSRVINKALLISLPILLIAFWLRGASAFAVDVDIIDCQVTKTTLWLEENTAPEATIAVHDIGAAGYFLSRPLVDLAGLITPEVIPFIRDEPRLLKFMEEREVDYLVTAPLWYPEMVKDRRLNMVYQRNCPTVRAAGGDEMAVYKIEW